MELVIAELQKLAATSSKELCGLVDTSFSIHPINNVADFPYSSFVFDRQKYFTTLKEIATKGQTVLCVYHTHPSGSTSPSKADLEFAKHSRYRSLIVTKTSFRWVM